MHLNASCQDQVINIYDPHRTNGLKKICKHANKLHYWLLIFFSLYEWEVKILWCGCGYDFFINIVSFSLVCLFHLCLMTTLPWRCSLQTVHSVWSWQMPTEVTLGNVTEHLVQHSVLSSSWNTLSEDVFHFAFLLSSANRSVLWYTIQYIWIHACKHS